MNAPFDPYYQWLGIPPNQQPPNHYRLLGVEVLERREDVITNGAERQRLFLQVCLKGPHAHAAQNLLDQVAAAQQCLTDPGAKAAYDHQLASDNERHGTPVWVVPAVAASATAFGVLCLVLLIAILTFSGVETPVMIADSATIVVDESEPEAMEAWESDTDLEKPSGEPVGASTTASIELNPVADADNSTEPISVVRATPSGSAAVLEPNPNSDSVVTADVLVREAPKSQDAVMATPASPSVTTETKHTVVVTESRSQPSMIPADRADKLTKPAADELKVTREQIKQLAKSQPSGTAAAASAKHEWPQTLLAQAAHAEKPAARYAMLEEAARCAADSGNHQLAFTAVSQLQRGFEVDTLPLKTDVLNRLTDAAKTLEDRHVLADLTAHLAAQAAEAEEFETADAIYQAGLKLARRVKDGQLLREMADRQKQLAETRVLNQAADKARERLRDAPDDPAANQALGEFLCFVRGDWTEGLKHLSKGANVELAAMSRQELAGVHLDAQRVQLGDRWFDWGRTNDTRRQAGAWSRSAGWYQAVYPRLDDKTRPEVDQRLAQMAAVLGQQLGLSLLAQRLPWLDGPVGQLRTFDGHTENVMALDISPSGLWLASASEDRTVRHWHLPTGKEMAVHQTETSNLNGVAITPDERFIIGNYDNNQLGVWPMQDATQPAPIPTSARSPTGLVVTPDGTNLIWSARSQPPNILVWSLITQQPVVQFGDGDSPSVIDLSADGSLLATGDSRGMVRVWDSMIGVPLYEFRAHDDAVTDLDLAPDGRHIASATFEEIRVTDFRRGHLIHEFKVPSARTVAFSPDGRRLASGAYREEIFLWEFPSGRELTSLKSESAFSERHILRIAFLPDPRGLVTGATEGKIRLWRLPE